MRLARGWKLGRKGTDDGASSSSPRTIAPCASRWVRPRGRAHRCDFSSRIINDTIVPLFKQGDFHGGVNAGLDQMMRVVDGEPLPAPDQALEARSGPRRATAAVAGRGHRARHASCATFIGRAPAALVAGSGGAGVAWWITSRCPSMLIGAASEFSYSCCSVGFGGGSGCGGGGGRVFRDVTRGGGFGWVRRRIRRWRRLERWRRQWRRRRRLRPLVVSRWISCACSATCAPRARARAGAFPMRSTPASNRRSRPRKRAPPREIRFVIETALDIPELWAGVTPRERAAAGFFAAPRLGHRTSQRRTHLCIGG